MRSAKSVGLLAALLLIAASAMSLVAWGKITMQQYSGGEYEWWYVGLHPNEVCSQGDADCEYGDRWSVELATYSQEDWAAVLLDCAERFAFSEVQTSSLQFTYKTLVHPQIGLTPDSGPHLAFWLANGAQNYVALSPAAPVQTASCTATANIGAGTWFLSEVDTETKAGEEYPALETMSAPTTGTLGSLQALAGAYEVKAVMVVMGVVGSTIGSAGGPIGAGQAVVDNVVLQWVDGATTFGGTYRLEEEWDATLTFDDWTSTPPPTDEELREWDKWCADPEYCQHCLQVDDQNLWTIVKESDLPSSVPAAARTFPSGDYAIYFGVKNQGNYSAGEASVGVVCSPYNELNPGDEFVSLTFDYFRQVESYMGAYDWTYAQVWFDDWSGLGLDPFSEEFPADVQNCGPQSDEDWKTIWYMDSRDASSGAWQQAVITHYVDDEGDAYSDDAHRIIIPPHATRMRIRFGFNSVDGSGNNYVGWIIDNVVKTHTPTPGGCRIITDHLPQGQVGEKYDFTLDPEVDGSQTGARSWSIVSVTKDGQRASLPRRLALDPTGRLYGDQLDPGTAGTYEILFRLDCYNGRPQEKTLVLTVRSGEAAACLSEDFEAETGGDWMFPATELPASDGGCDGNLWHQTDPQGVRYALEGATLAEYQQVAYFGTEDHTDPSYACGSRAKGCMTSILIAPSAFECEHALGQKLVIGFKSWRNVEYYPAGHYDQTAVYVRYVGDDWGDPVWYMDSSAPSLAQWTWEEVQTNLILREDRKIQIRFCFDSVDGYNNSKDGEAFGWLVDEISLYAGSAELAIAGCPEGETSVNEYYRELVTVAGGPEITTYYWELAAGALPPGIGFDNTTTEPENYFEGAAREAGDYTFTLRVRDADWENVATMECTIRVTRDVALLFEDFENDPAWGGTGLWHYTSGRGVKNIPDLWADAGDECTNHAAYYGREDTTNPNYATGPTALTNSRTDGMLTLVTPVISLTGVDAVKVLFDSWREVENFGNGGYDKTYVQVKLGNNEWKTIWERDSSDACTDEWTMEEVPAFLTNGEATMLIRFVFDSVDKWYNNYVGWIIDNIKIQSTSAAGANPLSLLRIDDTRAAGRDTPAEFQVMNIPNPVTDVHTTTFTVRSADVEAMKIAIYDLAGNKVYEEEVQGNELVWHTDNDYGEFLANGIYLYRAYVLVDGVWVETTVQKLVILR